MNITSPIRITKDSILVFVRFVHCSTKTMVSLRGEEKEKGPLPTSRVRMSKRCRDSTRSEFMCGVGRYKMDFPFVRNDNVAETRFSCSCFFFSRLMHLRFVLTVL